MAETLAEKLKRLAAEKKALAASSPAPVAEVAVAVNVQPKEAEVNEVKSGKLENPYGKASVQQVHGTELSTERREEAEPSEAGGNRQAIQQSIQVEDSQLPVSGSSSTGPDNSTVLTPTPSTHPLKMQFAEMEAALLTTDPTFKTILRDIHRHLGTDPDLVTQMTEEEVAMVVRGLVTFANAEIVAPAKAKAVKAASKKPISADDL